MTARPLDDGDLILIAAAAMDCEPRDVLAQTDVGALDRCCALIEAHEDPLDAAGAALVAVATERPFGPPSSAVAWLACAVAAPAEAARLATEHLDVVDLVCRAARGEMTVQDVRERLADQRGRLPWSCPECSRSLHVRDRSLSRGIHWVSPARAELVALCSVEHRAHGRSGQPLVTEDPPDDTPWRPAITNERTGALLVLADTGALVLLPEGDGYLVGDISFTAGDLVGDWQRMAERAHVRARVPRDAVVVDAARSVVDWPQIALHLESDLASA